MTTKLKRQSKREKEKSRLRQYRENELTKIYAGQFMAGYTASQRFSEHLDIGTPGAYHKQMQLMAEDIADLAGIVANRMMLGDDLLEGRDWDEINQCYK